ncbi:MAG: pyridoxal phosphate-dependent aminotransferase [Bryobacteraceae bacterium]|jgi:histidinol-phosphate aminotransferase
MTTVLSENQQQELLNRGFSRRTFGRIASILTAGAALPFYNEPALAQLSRVDAPPDAVMINSNENPLGPCKEAREAAHKMVEQGGRYLFGEAGKVLTILSEQEGLTPNHVNIYAGSSSPLHQAVIAFCSPAKPYVLADPGYEAGGAAAQFIGAPVIRVPLAKDYAHDVKAMAAASPTAGLIYICNPNNPTGTMTKRSDLDWLVANKPKGSIVMIDEAYTHIAGGPFCNDMVAADKDVVILRTFSKIYGMAGLRAGAAMARPDLLAKIRGWGHSGMMPITSMAAASASLQSKTLVPERRKYIADVRNDVLDFLDQHSFKCVPSVSNCFMVDTKRPARDVIGAMAREKVYIGRPWPVWPTHVRVTVGTQEEMDKFKAAFLKVMA